VIDLSPTGTAGAPGAGGEGMRLRLGVFVVYLRNSVVLIFVM
jgi:hypothetical protein